jgi:hypothetical protein
VNETKIAQTLAARGHISARGLQQGEGPQDVGFDKDVRAGDGAIDMAFGRKMNYGSRPMLCENRVDRIDIANVMLLENIARIVGDRRERGQVSRIGQFVDNNDIMTEIPDEVTAYRRTDKAGTPRDQNPHPVIP